MLWRCGAGAGAEEVAGAGAEEEEVAGAGAEEEEVAGAGALLSGGDVLGAESESRFWLKEKLPSTSRESSGTDGCTLRV